MKASKFDTEFLSFFFRVVQAVWSPMFTGYDGKTNIQVPGFWFAVGVPECEYHVMWPVYADATVSAMYS